MYEYTTNVAVKDDRENIAKVIQANQPKTKRFDPLNNSIQTNEVMDKTLSNYIQQIKTNIYIGKKAMYFVARDVYDAQQNLCNYDFNRLIERFKWNRSTESKMLAIGASNNLFEVYKEGNLPSAWTILYELTKLTDKEFEKIKLFESDLKFIFITSAVEIMKAKTFSIEVIPSPNSKCDRCWHYAKSVGQDSEHPSICQRCISNLFGKGEVRVHA